MKKLTLAFSLCAIAIANPVFSAASAATPCEDALKDLRAAEALAALSAADKTKVSDLEAEGVERCNARRRQARRRLLRSGHEDHGEGRPSLAARTGE
ncbi:hypothetical protein [Mesorhizobium sp. M0659]|uniref:hypothetical protein n=1 Tax=Mesorhizobium sp. M0659 TaxID=2956980 RepID=UPI003337CBA2